LSVTTSKENQTQVFVVVGESLILFDFLESLFILDFAFEVRGDSAEMKKA
jgi:hypothetical protein